jgi:hypothetical protein
MDGDPLNVVNFCNFICINGNKNEIKNVALVISNKTICMIFTMPQPRVSNQCFLDTFFMFNI